MKRWAGWFLILAAATAAVVALTLVRNWPSELERRHATIRPGMSQKEVIALMTPAENADHILHTVQMPLGSTTQKGTWYWVVPSRGRSGVELTVTFGDDGRVTETAVKEPP